MIKLIGTEARKELEASLECKVYLDLRVKVKSDWRDDERVLDDLGLPGNDSLSRTISRGARRVQTRELSCQAHAFFVGLELLASQTEYTSGRQTRQR